MTYGWCYANEGIDCDGATCRARRRDPALKGVRSVKHEAGNEYTTGQFCRGKCASLKLHQAILPPLLKLKEAVQHFGPDIALFVGIAGGVKDVGLGDVVASTKMYGYESGADREHFQPRPEAFLASYPLIQEAYLVAQNDEWLSRISGDLAKQKPKAFVGPIAAERKSLSHRRERSQGYYEKITATLLQLKWKGKDSCGPLMQTRLTAWSYAESPIFSKARPKQTRAVRKRLRPIMRLHSRSSCLRYSVSRASLKWRLDVLHST